jgi:DNA-binding MarR family transcriptional regulator
VHPAPVFRDGCLQTFGLTTHLDSCIIQRLSRRTIGASPIAFEQQIVGLIRALGLHRPDQTPCGAPISVGEAQALFELAHDPGISQNELAARLHLEKSTVSRLAKMLEQRGWLDRLRDQGDSRLLRLRLTAAGSKAVQRLSASRRARFAKVFNEIPAHKRDALLDSLSLLSEVLNEA